MCRWGIIRTRQYWMRKTFTVVPKSFKAQRFASMIFRKLKLKESAFIISIRRIMKHTLSTMEQDSWMNNTEISLFFVIRYTLVEVFLWCQIPTLN